MDYYDVEPLENESGEHIQEYAFKKPTHMQLSDRDEAEEFYLLHCQGKY